MKFGNGGTRVGYSKKWGRREIGQGENGTDARPAPTFLHSFPNLFIQSKIPRTILESLIFYYFIQDRFDNNNERV